jgi:hypothetical protein
MGFTSVLVILGTVGDAMTLALRIDVEQSPAYPRTASVRRPVYIAARASAELLEQALPRDRWIHATGLPVA